MQVEGISKAEVKAVLLQALAEKHLLKGTMRARSLESDLELQLKGGLSWKQKDKD